MDGFILTAGNTNAHIILYINSAMDKRRQHTEHQKEQRSQRIAQEINQIRTRITSEHVTISMSDSALFGVIINVANHRPNHCR